MKKQEFREIESKKLYLKPLVATFDFANHLFDIIDNNRDFFQYVLLAKVERPEEEFDWLRSTETNWKTGKSAAYGLFIKDTNEFVGLCSFFSISWSNEVGEIGYWLDPKYARQGFMTEAVNTVADEFFNMGFKRIVIHADLENTASCKTAEKCGFVREGIMKSATINSVQNKRKDVALYAKIKED